MAKINETEIRVIYADTDQMGIVYHANYLKYFEIGRTELLRELGMSYKECEEHGVMLPVKEVFVDYKASAKYDDLLIVRSHISELRKVSMKISYEIYEKNKNTLLTKGYTIHPFVNNSGRIIALEEPVISIVSKGV